MGRVQVGQVYEARHPGFSSNAGDPLGSFRVDVRVFEVPCERVSLVKLNVRGCLLGLVVPPDKVIDDVRVSETLRNHFVTTNVPFLPTSA